MKTRSDIQPRLSKTITLCLFLIFQLSDFYAAAQIAKAKAEIIEHQLFFKLCFQGHEKDTLNFIFDTGASGGVLDSTVAARLFGGSKMAETGVVDAAGSNNNVKVLEHRLFLIDQLQIDSVNFIIQNLKSISASKRVDGIIGYDLLKRYVIGLDIDRGSLTIYNKVQDVDIRDKDAIKFEMAGFLPQIPCSFTTVNGKLYHGMFILDSGAGVTAFLTTGFVNQNKLMTSTGSLMNFSSNGLSSKISESQCRIVSFAADKFLFSNLPIDLSQAKQGVLSSDQFSGILGNYLLYRFNIIFDYSHKTLYLSPNKTYSDHFQFPLAAIKVKESDGKVIISTIAQNSPESASGLKVGNTLTRINGRKNFNLADVKALLKREGRVRLTVLDSAGRQKAYTFKLYPRI